MTEGGIGAPNSQPMISATTTTAASPGATYCVRNRIRRSQSMWKSVGISRSTLRRKAKQLPSICVYPSACTTPTYHRHDGGAAHRHDGGAARCPCRAGHEARWPFLTHLGHRLCIAAFKTMFRHRLWQRCGLCATGGAAPPVESLSEFGKTCILMRLCARPRQRRRSRLLPDCSSRICIAPLSAISSPLEKWRLKTTIQSGARHGASHIVSMASSGSRLTTLRQLMGVNQTGVTGRTRLGILPSTRLFEHNTTRHIFTPSNERNWMERFNHPNSYRFALFRRTNYPTQTN